MKKAFFTITFMLALIFSAISVHALENTMTYTNLISNTNGYTFESVITPTVTTTCKPIITAYDESGAMCGIMYGDDITLTKGVQFVKTFKVETTKVPVEFKVMLMNTDGSYSPVSKAEQVSTALCTEKFGMVTELTSSGVQIFATDKTHNTYTLADKVVLSHSSGVVYGKTAATNYIDTLKLSYYTRGKQPATMWKIFADERTCFKESTAVAASAYKNPDFRDHYAKRMARFLVSSDGKIVSIAFEDDKLFKNLSSVKALDGAFYNQQARKFNDSLELKINSRILYIPTRKTATVSDYAVKAPSELKEGSYYYLKVYNANSTPIALVTFMYTDEEITSKNLDPLNNISIALNGDPNNLTIKGIKNYVFNISLAGQSDQNNDTACDAANDAMKAVAKGLEAAYNDGVAGYYITPDFVKIRYKAEIQEAKQYIKIIQDLDKTLSTKYYDELINKMPEAIGNSAASFLQDYFLGD